MGRIKRFMVFVVMCLLSFPVWASEVLMDFSKPQSSYRLVTDATERNAGKSHGDLSYQAGKKTRQSYFFSCLQPQPNGAAFVSFLLPVRYHFGARNYFVLTARSLNSGPVTYQMILETAHSRRHGYSYKQSFTVRGLSTKRYRLPMVDFKPSYRGRQTLPAIIRPLNPRKITELGLRIVGRLGRHKYQRGCYALALDKLSVGSQ